MSVAVSLCLTRIKRDTKLEKFLLPLPKPYTLKLDLQIPLEAGVLNC
jgi:hypothetical protein